MAESKPAPRAPKPAKYKKDPGEETADLDEETQAALIATLGDRYPRVLAIAKELGIDPGVIARLTRRIQVRYQPLTDELKSVTTGELVDLLEDRAWRALSYLDDDVLSQASARDLAVIVGIMTEKRQLLRGEPTAILSHHERQTLNELTPLLVQEAQRRGFLFDVLEDGTVMTDAHVRPRNQLNNSIGAVNKRKAEERRIERGEPV